MKFTKKSVVTLLVTILIVYVLALYKLPYYIYKPGGADALDPVVSVEGGYKSKGDMHLVTVSGGQATPVSFVLAKMLPYYEVQPIENVIPEHISEKEYMDAQLHMMESSQEAATVVAYEAANADIDIKYDGVYVVSVVKGMPAEGKLKAGDEIKQVDSKKINNSDDLLDYVKKKKSGDKIKVHFERENKQKSVHVTLQEFEELNDKIGIGIQLVTNRDVHVKPKVHFESGDIGGPSAGLMFALKIYDELKEEDLTHGKQIIGTGEIDYEGNVLPIGGIDKKVVAADKEGGDIFFAPNENGTKGSNYEIAKKTADDIGTDMKIVPVDTFKEALDYLEKEM
ncbi:MAG TPA: PDZ domain-containing protein [Candidatus Avamphibacillus intestinigallinarum]|nr:PDZ domain-containing protein [Candidatus Avamphibacillus intestinigallinarum]